MRTVMLLLSRSTCIGLALLLPLAACGGGSSSDKTPASTVRFLSTIFQEAENIPAAIITVERAGSTSAAITVDYATADNTATAGSDYTPASGTLIWAAGEAVPKSFTVIIQDDIDAEGNEIIDLTLSNPTGGATLDTPSAAQLIILDDDVPGSLQLSTSAFQIAENGGSLQIPVQRIGGVGGAVTVDYATSNGTALVTADYVNTFGTLAWAPGDGADKTIPVPIVDDFLIEPGEVFNIALGNPTGGAILGTPIAAGVTILDDDVPGSLQLSAATYQVDEDAGSTLITVQRVGGLGGAVGVSYATSDGTATEFVDYVPSQGTLSWGPGDGTDRAFTVLTVPETLVEPDETVNLTLSAPTGGAALGNPNTGVLTIVTDDVALQLSASAYQVDEDTGSTQITVQRVGDIRGAVSVDYATSDGTATEFVDYVPSQGTLNWGPGDGTDKAFTVLTIPDFDVEPDETVNLTLSAPTGGAILGLPAAGVLTVTNDDVPGSLQLSAATYQVDEDTGSTLITVQRVGGLGGAVGVSYATSDGTATEFVDYVPSQGTLSWPSGDGTDRTFTVLTIPDSGVEPDETVNLTLSIPTGGAALGTPSTGLLTIVNDDVTLQFTSATFSVSEGGVNASLTVSRLGTTVGAVGISYATSDVTAVAPGDYTDSTGPLAWPDGDGTDKTILIPIQDDFIIEPDETLDIALSAPTGGAGVGAQGTARLTILNDDVPGVIQFAFLPFGVEEDVGSVQITVQRTGGLGGTVGVQYDTDDGTAIAPGDYTDTTGTLSWGPGDGTDKTFTVITVPDPTIEPDETVDLTLSNPTGGATLGGPITTQLTILNDDLTLRLSSATYSVDEAGGSVTITVNRVGSTIGAISVDHATANGTAAAPGDYTDTPGTLNWLDGDGADKTFQIPIQDDFVMESNETVDITLSNPTGGATLGTPSVAVLTILDNDVSISGTVTYDLVPAAISGGLDYPGTVVSPCRGVIVEGVRSSDGVVIDSTTADSFGDYTVVVTRNTLVYVRVKAQLNETAGPSWDFQVVDNVNGKALYSAVTLDFNSGSVAITGEDLHMDSGWGGSSYTSTRMAAPFAILDTVYTAVQKILTVDPAAAMPQLLINWSVSNVPVQGDKDQGNIGGSHYDPGEVQIYLLGAEDNNTEEYDRHVIVHEWTHYLQHQFSRNDNLGGPHAVTDRLDSRVSFGEGLATGFSGILLDDPDYVDTRGTGQGTSSYFDIEDNSIFESSEGWFNEASVFVLIYDLYDSADDGADTASLGLAPLYDVLVNDEGITDSASTIHSFTWHLKQNNPLAVAQINSLLADEAMTSSAADIWDSTGTETNDGGEPIVLPLYKLITPGGPSASLCTNGNQGNMNKLANHGLFYFEITVSATYSISAAPVASGDAEIWLFQQGTFVGGVNSFGAGGTETLTLSLTPGWYVGDVFHRGHVFGLEVPQECFDVTIN